MNKERRVKLIQELVVKTNGTFLYYATFTDAELQSKYDDVMNGGN